jgi:hypothetical protein
MLCVQIKAFLHGLVGRAVTATIILVTPFLQSSLNASDVWSLVREGLFLFCDAESESQFEMLGGALKENHGVTGFSKTLSDNGWAAEILTQRGVLSLEKIRLQGGPGRLIVK